MLQVILFYNKLEKSRGRKLNGRNFRYRGVQIRFNHHGYYYVELPQLDSEIPAAVADLAECLCFEENIPGPGHQWRHGDYRHLDTGEASAFFDKDGKGNRVLKMRAQTRTSLIELRKIVMQVKPGDRNRMNGLIEPPIDAWNAGYEACMTGIEDAITPVVDGKLAIVLATIFKDANYNEKIWPHFSAWRDSQPDKGGNNAFIKWVATLLPQSK